jgi:hypothetical protein
MYLFSALNKLNPVFISGQTLAIPHNGNFIWQPYVRFSIEHSWLAVFSAISIIIFQLLGAFLIFERTKVLGYLGAFLFHFSSAVALRETFVMFVGTLGLAFLLGFKWANRKFYYFVFVYSFIFTTTQILIEIFFSDLGKNSFEFASIKAGSFFILLFFWLIFQSAYVFKNGLFQSIKINSHHRLIPFALTVFLFVFCRILNAPVPFGYTQYSGIETFRPRYGVAILYKEGSDLAGVRRGLARRWEFNLFFDRNNPEFFISVPMSSMRENLIQFFCKVDDAVLMHKFRGVHVNKASRDFTDTLSYMPHTIAFIKNKLNGSEAFRCGESVMLEVEVPLHFNIP